MPGGLKFRVLNRALEKTQSGRALVPMAEMFGYATGLRSATQGRGVFSIEFDHYAPVPESVARKLLNL